MRILHTADWHIGRSFHGHSTLEALSQVLGAIPDVVSKRGVDVVVAAGDIFDSAVPSADAFNLLQETLLSIRDAGAKVVLISGNHDSAARLGFAAPFARLAGVHLATDPGQIGIPVTFEDQYGSVDFYCVPYLEPALIRHRWPDEQLHNQADALRFAVGRVREGMDLRAGARARSVLVAHTFVAGGESASADSERPITAGAVDAVPLSTFDGFDYVALGHIHGRARLADHVRYSGAMLHYSFSEAGKPRGGWLIELDAHGAAKTEWVSLPVPRALVVLRGELEDLLVASPQLDAYHDDWVSAILTDTVRPVDAMRRLQARFPWCAQVEHRPAVLVSDGAESYAERVQGKTDDQVVEAFLAHVRNGSGPTEAEVKLFEEVVAQHAANAGQT